MEQMLDFYQRGLSDQKSGHAPFLVKTVKTSYN